MCGRRELKFELLLQFIVEDVTYTVSELILNSETSDEGSEVSSSTHDIMLLLQTTVKVTPVVEGDNSLK